jgi:hypothetical protein
MPRPLHYVVAGVAVAGLAVGGYFGFKLFSKPVAPVAPLDTHKPHERQKRDVPAITFTDVTAASGVRFTHYNGSSGGEKLLPETMGGGVAVFDYDGDGKPDVLFVGSGWWPASTETDIGPTPLKLYKNLGGMKFEDVTKQVGFDKINCYGMGVAVGDYDNDGKPDVFVSCVGKHRLFRNIEGKRFEDVTAAAGVAGPADVPQVTREQFLAHAPPIPFGASATFLDYDGDGKLDLFVCHYLTWSPAIDKSINATLEGGKRAFVQPKDFQGANCTLYRNAGGGKFVDVSKDAGILVEEKEGTAAGAKARPVGKSLGVLALDADGDGWPDLYVANDTVRNFFFHNVPGPNGTRRFEEKGLPIGAAYADSGAPRAGMGIDWGEFAPGRFAAVVANFANEPLTFFEKTPAKLLFSDSTTVAGLSAPSRAPLKFGTFFFDYDNDGRLDLLVSNGHIEPDVATIQESQTHAQPVHLYWNTGDDQCFFEPVTAARGGKDLFAPMVGRGCTYADLDGDGDLDLILVANGGAARVLRNDAPATNKSLRLDLRGDGAKSNRSAIGAVVTVEAGGKTYVRHVAGARGYLSQPELVLTVGIGTGTKADKVTVRWPGKDAASETWTNLAPGAHTLEQGKAK